MLLPSLVVAGLLTGVAMLLASLRRAAAPPLREAAMRSRIAELEPGRFRVTGRVVPIRTSPSEVDGTPCVYLERARYEPIGAGWLPLLRKTAHACAAHRFYLDDGTGRILVDPAASSIECATVLADGGLLAERRLRAGEEIEIVAQFRPAEGVPPVESERGERDVGPYRAAASRFEPAPDEVGPPRITYRTERGMELSEPDERTTFLRGAGALLIATSLLFGGLFAWLRWVLSPPL